MIFFLFCSDFGVGLESRVGYGLGWLQGYLVLGVDVACG